MAGLTDILTGVQTAVAVGAIGALGYDISQSVANLSNEYASPQAYLFPSDLIDINSGRQFYMTFFFYQYQRPSIFLSPSLYPMGSITLPIPSSLIDSQSVDYNSNQTLSPIVGAAMDSAVQGYNSAQGAIQAAASTALGALAGGVKGSGAQALDSLNALGNAAGLPNIANQFLQAGGLAVNPYLTVLFQAPVFKRHTFSWKFIPNNLQETQTLKFILNKFRYHQLPDSNQATAGTLLQYPDMCIPVISPSGYVYSFKHCVIESAEANYAPGATPGFKTSNAPSAYQLTLRLLEIEYWLKKDFYNTIDPNLLAVAPNSVTLPTGF